MRTPIALLAALVAALIVFSLSNTPSPVTDQAGGDSTQLSQADEVALADAKATSAPSKLTNQSPRGVTSGETDPGLELVQSIFAQGPDVTRNSVAASEQVAAAYESLGPIRWETVFVDVEKFVGADYMTQQSAHDSLTISPFSDTAFNIRKTGYKVFPEISQAIWEGEVIGVDDSSVQIAIVGGIDEPSIVVKVSVGQRVVSLVPLDEVPGAFVAIENYSDVSVPID